MICNKCNLEKSEDNFYKSSKYCKDCYNKVRKCIHNKVKITCKECSGSQICEHNKVKSHCKECDGSLFCEHNKNKRYCRECNGTAICEHNKIKYKCKECKGSQMCEHNKFKYSCKECNGNGICEHNKFKQICKKCNGSQLCTHNIQKTQCRECNGSAFCIHNKRKISCKKCNGTAICEHNNIKYSCKECGGSQICEHNIGRDYCKDCKGNQICEHNKNKSRCKECKGSQICKHNKVIYQCYDCKPDSKYFCKQYLCEISASTKKFRGYCSRCFFFTFPNEPITRNYKTKENSVVDFIKKEFKQYDITFDKQIQDGCTKRRPDLLFDFGEKVIIVEIDENQHTDYDTTCEQERLNNLMEDINYRNLILIKFNPDGYKIDNKIKRSPWVQNKDTGILEIKNKKEWNQRLTKLKEILEEQIKNEIIEFFKIIPLFYNFS